MTAQGGDDSLDSDGPTPPTVTLQSGDDDRSVDYGVFEPGSISGRVWNDVDAEGIQDDPNQEPSIAGGTVTLTDPDGNPVVDADGNPVGPVQTDANGIYVFTNLRPGTYIVEFAPPAGSTVSPTGAPGSAPGNDSNGVAPTVTVLSGANTTAIDLGLQVEPEPPTTSPPTSVPIDNLPSTGSSSTRSGLVVAIALLAAGLALVGFSRRRSTARHTSSSA